MNKYFTINIFSQMVLCPSAASSTDHNSKAELCVEQQGYEVLLRHSGALSLMLKFHSQPQMLTKVTEVIRIHSLEKMNFCTTFHGNPFSSC